MLYAEPVPAAVIDAAIRAAATAPSGANIQPWRFVVLTDPAAKRQLREAAEAEDREFYQRRIARVAVGVGAVGHRLGNAVHGDRAGRDRRVRGSIRDRRAHGPHYVKESVGIAVGLLLATLH